MILVGCQAFYAVLNLKIDSHLQEFEDETLSERLWGLTEMFPEPLRNATAKTANYSVVATKKLYRQEMSS